MRRSTRADHSQGWGATLVPALLCALVAAACGGSSGSEDGAGPEAETPLTTLQTDGERPEGAWTMVEWQTSRSDLPDLAPGTAQERRVMLEPACASGPCDVEVSPNGVAGTYLPAGVATPAAATPNESPFRLVWDQAAGTYTGTTQQDGVHCTNAALESVPDAYRLETVVTLTYTPAQSGRHASLVGTYDETATSTPAGEAGQCTPFRESGSTVGTPTGALDGDDPPDVAGAYTVTEIVDEIEPAGQRPAGFAGLLPPMTLAAVGDGYTVTGVLGTATPLTRSASGWGGTSSQTPGPCEATAEPLPDGFASNETWTDLRPVALAADGTPVLSGGWRLFQNPTEAGAALGCTLTTNTGHIILVPTAAL